MNKKYKAQIMLITLIVLTILSIVTVTAIVLNSRDVAEVVVNKKYDEIYSASENKVLELVNIYGTYESTLASLGGDQNCIGLDSNTFSCNFELESTNFNIESDVSVSDEKDIVDYKVFKDRSIELKLNGYRGDLDIYWDKPGQPISSQASLEFVLIYRDSGGNYKAVIDIFNGVGVYDSTPIHRFTFSENPVYSSNTTTARRISFVGAISATDTPILLSITPRMNNLDDSVDITIIPTIAGTYPDQIRKFESKAYDPLDGETPVVNLITQIPLYPQTLGLFDYLLLSEGDITIN